MDSTTTLIADNIRGYRNKRRWTQERLGQESGLNGSYIGEVERGIKHITVFKLVEIAKALNIKPFLFLIEQSYDKSSQEIEKVLRQKN